MLQHQQHLQNFTDQLHVHIFAKPISSPTAKNLKIKKTYVQKSIKKQEVMNLMPALAFLAFLINFLIAFLDSNNNFLDITMTTFNSNNNFLDSILNNLHKDVEDIINRKWSHHLRKFNQSIRMNYKY